MNKIIKHEDEAEDIAQDIFVKLWHSKELLSEIKSFDHYLYKMARNTIYNWIEHQYVVRAHFESLESNPINNNDTYKKIYAKEVEELINRSIENMPAQRKRVFLMSREEGLSNLQIAEYLNISKRTVDCHISLALAELKKLTFILLLFIFG